MEAEEVAGNHFDDASNRQPGRECRMRALQGQYFRVGGLFGEDGFPAGQCGAGRGIPAAGTFDDGIKQIAHRVDFGELRLFDVSSHLFFDLAEQFDALHGIEPQVEFQIVRGP